jgi:hypothetical protein
VGSKGPAKDIRAEYSSLLFGVLIAGDDEGIRDDGMFPRALKTARVAHALLTVWCAKNPGKRGSGSPPPGVAVAFVFVLGLTYLKRKIRAWMGWRAASESGSREYRSSTIRGSPSVFNSSLLMNKDWLGF